MKAFENINYFNKIVKNYKDNKEYILKELREVKKLHFNEPMGAFYFYLNVQNYGVKSIDLSNKILMQTGVVLTPGNDFDKKYGSNFLRLAFSGHKNIVKGTKRLVEWFESH